MFQSGFTVYRYEITESVATGVRRIEELRARLDAQGPLPRIWLGRTRRDLEAEVVAASTIMEGVAVTVDEARRILAGDRPTGVSVEDIDLVDGYRDAMRFVLARRDRHGPERAHNACALRRLLRAGDHQPLLPWDGRRLRGDRLP